MKEYNFSCLHLPSLQFFLTLTQGNDTAANKFNYSITVIQTHFPILFRSSKK